MQPNFVIAFRDPHDGTVRYIAGVLRSMQLSEEFSLRPRGPKATEGFFAVMVLATLRNAEEAADTWRDIQADPELEAGG